MKWVFFSASKSCFNEAKQYLEKALLIDDKKMMELDLSFSHKSLTTDIVRSLKVDLYKKEIVNDLGKVYENLGLYEHSRNMHEIAIRSSKLKTDFAEAYYNTARILHQYFKNYDEAKSYYLKALENRKISRYVADLASLYNDVRDYNQAEAYYLETIDIINIELVEKSKRENLIKIYKSYSNSLCNDARYLLSKIYAYKAFEINKKGEELKLNKENCDFIELINKEEKTVFYNGDSMITSLLVFEHLKYQYLASGHVGGRINIWNLLNNRLEYSIKRHSEGDSNRVWALEYINVENSLYLISAENNVPCIFVTNFDNKESYIIRELAYNLGKVKLMKKDLLAICSVHKRIILYDVDKRKYIAKLAGHTDIPRAISTLTLNGSEYLVTGGCDCLIIVWNLSSLKMEFKLPKKHEGNIHGIVTANMKGKDYIISGGKDKLLVVWDPVSQEPIKTVEIDEIYRMKVVNFGDKKLLACACFKFVRLFDLTDDMKEIGSYYSESDVMCLESFQYPTDKRKEILISGTKTKQILFWNVSCNKSRDLPLIELDKTSASALSNFKFATLNTKLYLIACSTLKEMLVWNIEEFTKIGKTYRHKVIDDLSSPIKVTHVCNYKGKEMLVAGSLDGILSFWDFDTFTKVLELTIPDKKGRIRSITSIILDNKLFLVNCCDNKYIYFWDVDTGLLSFKMSNDEDVSVLCSYISSTGLYCLASGGSGGQLSIWDLKTKESSSLSEENEIYDDVSTLLSFTLANRPYLVSYSKPLDGDIFAINIWDPATKSLAHSLSNMTESIVAVEVTHTKGKVYLVVACSDRKISFYEIFREKRSQKVASRLYFSLNDFERDFIDFTLSRINSHDTLKYFAIHEMMDKNPWKKCISIKSL